MKILVPILISALGLVSTPLAGACSCAPVSTKENVERAMRSEMAIFRGELIAHKGGSAVFRVDEQWNGNLGAFVEFQWRDGSRGDCNGFWPELLKVGNKMIVFGIRAGHGVYRTSICLPTIPLSEASEVLRILGPGASRAMK